MATERELDRRPDPDALLALTNREGRGKLRVFLGAAPGVGKTFSMLQRARAARAEGEDILIGLVETHGRRETEALIEGLEVLPRRAIDYRGRTIEEFDLDAALKRKPKIIVVDELAHTNAPDSRHPKRWQDVEDLLDAGIDVWTALNVQHVESLADVVTRIANIAVRETVPDRVLQEADDVILVDLTPDELLQRLKEGKVYLPETAQRASQNFFTQRNLTALRELALRRTAERVDDQMVEYLRQSAIEGPWETTERLLVCVGADDAVDVVVRAAARLATGLNASWVAITVERAGSPPLPPDRAKRVHAAMALAERLGASTERVSADDLPGEILRYARRENITQIVIGRSHAGFLQRLLGRSLTEEIVRRSPDIAVHVIVDERATPKKRLIGWKTPRPDALAIGFGAAFLTVALTTALGVEIESWRAVPNITTIFVAPIVVCAARFGVLSALAAAALSFLANDYFFVSPLYTLSFSDPQDFVALIVFVLVAVVTGLLASRMQENVQAMRERAQTTQTLLEYSRQLSGAAKIDDILWTTAAQTQKAVEAKAVVVLTPESGDLVLRAAWPPVDALTDAEMSAARWALDKDEAAGWRTDTLPRVRFQFRPLSTARGVVAVCGIEPQKAEEPFSPRDDAAITSLLQQTTIAIDRSQLVGEAVKSAALEENERLRTTLLSSLSHDLRTPLTAIAGAVSSLRTLGDKLKPEDRADLLASIDEETQRLTGFIANLLDMSRIESGGLAPKRETMNVEAVIRRAAERARRAFPRLPLALNIAADLPRARGDATLLEQVIFNLLDNANKYAEGGAVTIHARIDGAEVAISVTDEGPGVKPADLERIFEKFYRGGRPDGRKAGAGLGLAISRGLVEAMGGTISAQSPAARRRGLRIVIRLPIVPAKTPEPA